MAIKYDNCKNCHSKCIYAGKDREFVCINGVSCKITMEKPQTNADRIRAMSDEELADVVANGVGCVLKAPHCKDVDCTPCILRWLQQPAKGE